ncbi:thiol reductant ABC exporter subunit CydD [Kitasatospora sp. YST-16]|uniref:thiol reductant ABC exporter subunit CydD n=1 Tax=unclassified Kitasatospora TaxID=2633591 RepID=UPI0004C3F82E|nr:MULTISPECIES: thiol reductant ABC exporter subunit CydD [unclassified Kitasatospora]WAL76424.1 thiol reductant ABC exporter subunit CydD [Kitasatospora sp. YST-16]WNW42451.1 thiol reductant ABC exporter subunit CydD [Streptomyces sp. Li-HN-5-13]
MRPIDPRLLAHARTTRAFLAGSVLLGGAGAALLVAQAGLIASLVVGAFQDGRSGLWGQLLGLAAVTLGRALVAWLTELTAHRSVAAVKSTLRRRLLDHATALGPAHLTGRRTGDLATLATRGVDALDDYFARYLPQLALAVVVPLVVLARILGADWESAAIVCVTLPLIPLFMVLIGYATQARTDRQFAGLARLSHHFLDVVAGLPTLKVFGRARAQAAAIGRITEDYRRATLRTLRLAFVSSFALELLSTLSVALVAVSIGFRLVNGTLDLETGLLVLVLAPEVYLPIRQVGALYHSSAEGLAAAGKIFEVLETPLPAGGTRPAPTGTDLRVEDLTVRHPGRAGDTLSGFSMTVPAGRTTVLTGPSGAGKTTLVSVLLGFTRPDGGRVLLGGQDLADTDPASWHAQVAWVPQHPQLFAGTVAENVRLARPDASEDRLAAALAAAHVDFTTPDTLLAENGHGLSAGQRQRLALARALLADRPVLILDEPTAHLDPVTEAALLDTLRTLDRTVLLITHRPALTALADHHVHLPGAENQGRGELREAGGEVLRTRHGSDLPLEGAARQGADRGTEAASEPDPAAAASRPAQFPAPLTAATRVPRFWLAVLLGALALGCAVALMGTSGWLISRASQMPPVLYLMVAVTSVRAFGIGRSVFRYAERLVAHDAVLRALGGVRTAVYRRLERLAPAGLPQFRRGDLLSRLVADVDAVQDFHLRWRLPAAVAVLVSLGASAALAAFLPLAGLVLALGLLLAGAAVPALERWISGRTERRHAPARGDLASAVLDTLTGTAELTVAGALPRRLGAARDADRALTRLAARSAAASGLSAGLVALVSGLTVVAAAAVGVRAVASGSLPGVCLAVVVLTPLAAFEAVAGMPTAVRHRERARASRERLDQVLAAPLPVREPDAPRPLPEVRLPVLVRDLTVRWPGAERDALHGVGLELAAGRRIAVVGASGSGKTTLAQALLRFVEPSAGAVLLAGRTDTRELAGEDVRRVVGLCAQDAHVFDSSVRENLRLARPDADEAALRAALDRARLLEWADGLPEGLDTMVGEHGARLSGGQRQRLALARALLADFPVLILDEPAEHLDTATADALTADLLAATADRATLLITHRLAGLDDDSVDEVLVLDAGRVVERGRWSELADRPDGRLAALLERERAGERAPARA